MSSLRRVKKAPKNVISERKWDDLEGEYESQKGCLKYHYDNQKDFDDLNLPCTDRFWRKSKGLSSLESFNDVDVYRPKQMEDYTQKHFSNDRFNGRSPFVFQKGYRNKTNEQVCNIDGGFNLTPQQKFAGKFISTETTFPGMLVYHGLGSGKTCTSIIVGEAMKSRTTEDPDSRIQGRSPYRVFIVVPKAIKEQYYEEIIGRIRDGKIVSCPGACVITETDDEQNTRQFYVGEYNYETDKYSTSELNEMGVVERRINKLSKDPTKLNDKKTREKLLSLNRHLKKLRDSFHAKVDTVYHIVSHDTFLNSVMVKIRGTNKTVPTNFLLTDNIFHSNKSLLIIDEIQKLVREDGSKYNKLHDMLNIYARDRETGEPTMKVVLLTATPVYDNPHEAALMINLLRPRMPFPQNRDKFQELFITKKKQIKNPMLLKYMLSGYVSYFKGGNPQGYPYRRNHIMLHVMHPFQQKQYSSSLVGEILKEQESQQKKKRTEFALDPEKEIPQGIYPISIQKANIAYAVQEGEIKTSLGDIASFMSELKSKTTKRSVFETASRYSKKFVEIIKIAEKSPGPVFIYSKWIPHGIVGLYSILDAIGWKFLGPRFDLSGNENRYAIWSPGGLDTKGVRPENQVNAYIKNMRQIFNSPENKDGKLIKVLISNVVEGISLKGVNQVHVCEPWWNMSKMEQIIARAIRLCSHSHLPKDRQFVDVYYHASVLSSYPNYNTEIQSALSDSDPKLIYYKDLSRLTIEQKMYIAADKKQDINVQFELMLKESSVDCNLNDYGNIVRLEETRIPSIATDGIIEDDGRTPLYNRSNNKYYFLEHDNKGFYLEGLNVINTVDVPKLSRGGGVKNLVNWPPVGVQRDNTKVRLKKWQLKIIAENTSVTILESSLFKDGCDISGPSSDIKFRDLYKLAVEQHNEDPEAWNYCYDMFRKMELFGKVAVKYNLITGGSPVPLQNKLYSILKNASSNRVFDSIPKKEKKKHIKILESVLVKNEALKDKQSVIEYLVHNIPGNTKSKMKDYSYTELIGIKEKFDNNHLK